MTTDNDEIIALEKKAKDGDPEAQYALGMKYYEGKVVSQDYKKAEGLFRDAAKQYYIDAQFMLGLMYDEGKGITHNYREAVKWYRLAGDQGHTDSWFRLGEMYALGKGSPKNYRKAYVCFSLAALDGNEEAVTKRDDMEKKLSTADLSLAQQEASGIDEKIQKKIAEREEMSSAFLAN